jgi:hypothetical protein
MQYTVCNARLSFETNCACPILAIYGPMIYIAPYVILLMRPKIYYEGKWEGVGPWKSRLLWVL